jgi:hypothetical protein
METLANIWNEFWWVIPVGLFALCFLSCLYTGRRAGRSRCPCMRWWGDPEEEEPSRR